MHKWNLLLSVVGLAKVKGWLRRTLLSLHQLLHLIIRKCLVCVSSLIKLLGGTKRVNWIMRDYMY